ncbi:MAG TPA: hypothetical protein VGB66_16160, partial [Longimicrobium sp.]
MALMLPNGRRSDWLREWTAELEYVERRRGPVLRMLLGAVLDTVELSVRPGAFAGARFGGAPLRRRPLHASGAVLVLASGISAAALVLTLAGRAVARDDFQAAGGLLVAAALLIAPCLVVSAAAAAGALLRRAVRRMEGVPQEREGAELRSAATLLGMSGGVAALMAAWAAM